MKTKLSSISAVLVMLTILTFAKPADAQTAPSILLQPQSFSRTNDDTVYFQVDFSGSPDMVAQWYFNGQSISGTTTDYPGALSATNFFSLRNINTNNAGDYTVVITNDWGSITSSVAVLSVTYLPNGTNMAPTFVAQPQSIFTTNGAPLAQFVVIANGTPPLVSQWYYNGQLAYTVTNKLGTYLNGMFSSSNSLSLYNVSGTNAGAYQVVVTNSWGSITSSVVTLTVFTNTAPAILAQPQSVTTASGGSAQFTVSFDGTPMASFGAPFLSIHWYFDGQSLNNSQFASGITNLGLLFATNTLQLSSVTTTNAGSYQAIISNSWGSVTSSIASLTITNAVVATNNPPVIAAQPQSVSVANGGTATFSVFIAGSPDMVSQWFYNGQFVSGTTNAGLLSATNYLVLPDVGSNNAGAYTVVITNDWGSITSSVAMLTITSPPVMTNTPPLTNSAPYIVSQPQSLWATNGQTVAFGVVVTGSTNMVSQWYFNGALVDGPFNLGLTLATNSLVLPDVDASNAGNYTVVITNNWGSITSSIAMLNLTNTTVITSGPQDTTNQPPTFVAQPQNLIATNGTPLVQFSVVANGTPPLISQWYFNGQLAYTVTNSYDTYFNGAFSASNSLSLYNVSGTNAGAYQVVVANGWGSVTSSVVTLAVFTNTVPAILAQPQSVTTASGGSAQFTVSFDGTPMAGFGAPFLSIHWYFDGQSLDTSPFASGITNLGLLFATNTLQLFSVTTTNAGSYQAIISNSWGSVTSSIAMLTITNAVVATNNPPAILAQPQSVSVASGATATFKVIAAGSPDMVAQWFYNGQFVSAITNSGLLTATNSLVLPAVTSSNAGSYTVVITNDWGSVTSSVATLTIYAPPSVTNSAPTIVSQPQGLWATNGQTVTFNVLVAGSTNMVSQWFFNGALVSGTTNFGLTLATNSLVLPDVGPASSGNYQVVITNNWGSITSSVAVLNITNAAGIPDSEPLIPASAMQISIASVTAAGVTLNLYTTPSTSSQIWAATNLVPPVVWQSIDSNTPGTNGVWQFTDTNASLYPVRFYRTSTP